MADNAARAIYLAPITGITKNKTLNKTRIHFPVTPSEYQKSGSSQWAAQNIVGIGEVKHPMGQSLPSWRFTSFFPPVYTPHLCKGLRSRSDFIEPKEACAIMEELRDSNDVMWLVIGTELATEGLKIIGQSDSNVAMEPVFISDFSWSETAGRIDQRLYDISFGGWTSIRRGPLLPFAIPKTYRPLPTEDLRDVAVRFYSDVDQWVRIRDKNKLKTVFIPKNAKGVPKVLLLPPASTVTTTQVTRVVLPGVGAPPDQVDRRVAARKAR